MAAVFTRLNQNDILHICKSFSLGELESFDGVADGSVNSIYFLNTSQGEFFLRLEEVKSDKDLELEVKFLRFVGDKDLQVQVPLPLPLFGQNTPILHYQGHSMLVFKRAKGVSHGAHALTERQLATVGRWLAQFHRVSRGFSTEIPDRFDFRNLWTFFEQVRPVLLEKENGQLKPYVEALEAEFAVQRQNHMRSLPVPQGIVHGDLFADNLMFEGDALASVIDFDAAASGPLLYDVATALHALCFKGQDFSRQRCASFLEGYEMIRVLEPEERFFFNHVMRFSALRFTLTRIKDFYLREESGGLADSALIRRDFRDFYRRLEVIRHLGEHMSFLDFVKKGE